MSIMLHVSYFQRLRLVYGLTVFLWYEQQPFTVILWFKQQVFYLLVISLFIKTDLCLELPFKSQNLMDTLQEGYDQGEEQQEGKLFFWYKQQLFI